MNMVQIKIPRRVFEWCDSDYFFPLRKKKERLKLEMILIVLSCCIKHG